MLSLVEGLVLVQGAAIFGLGLCFARLLTRVQRFVPRESIDYYVQFRLMQMLPLPHLGNRQQLLECLSRIAPGRPLALFSVAHPPLLVLRQPGSDEPSLASGEFIEAHLERLKAGAQVHEPRCGTLLPALTRYGDLRAVVVVVGLEPVSLDEQAMGTLRYIAGVIEYPSALHVWPAPLRPERDCIRPTPVP